jgi:hypothetical protein
MTVAFPAPHRTCFWTGAGISADYPSALPLGDELTRVIVSEICGPDVWRVVCEDFRAAQMVSSSGRPKSAPRLEWVTEHLSRVVGEEAIAAFRPLAAAPPNALHEFFAAHLEGGGRHVTVNFDRCIERAVGDSNVAGPVHLHGRLSPGGLGNLRTRTLQLTTGLAPGDTTAVVEALESSELVVFLGYSGRDYFDVDPFFRELAAARPGSLQGLEVLWVEHNPSRARPSPLDWRHAPVVDGRPILQAMEQLGASVTYVHGLTSGVLAEAASTWNLAPPAPSPAARAASSRARTLQSAAAEISVSRANRLRATAVLWFSMGVGHRVVELERRLSRSADPIEQEVHADLPDLWRIGLMSVGYYRQAARLAKELEDPAERHQALATAYRLRGSAARSLWHILRALSFCAAPTSSDPEFAGVCGDAREGYVAWYRSARMGVGGGLVAAGRRVVTGPFRLLLRRRPWFDPVRVFEEFRDCEPYVVAHPHAVEQISRAWREVPEFGRTGPLPKSIVSQQVEGGAVYVETDHFLGHLDSERHLIALAVAASRRPGGPPGPTRAALERHRRLAERQADPPGQLKAVLLERFAGHSGAPFPRSALLGVEWTRRNKVLWLWRWATRRWPGV